MEHHDAVANCLAKAGFKGLTKAELSKIVGITVHRIDRLLNQLKASGSVRGPFKIGRFSRYFIADHAPTRKQVEARIQERLLDAGLKLTSFSALEATAKNAPKALFKDALSALKAEGKIVELKGARRSKLYVHGGPLLEQLRVESQIPVPMPDDQQGLSLSLDDVRPVYETLKAQQGGISAVPIFDVWKGVGGSKEELHRLLLDEAKRGRVTLHPTSTFNFPNEVLEAGIRVSGQPHPFITVVMKA